MDGKTVVLQRKPIRIWVNFLLGKCGFFHI